MLARPPAPRAGGGHGAARATEDRGGQGVNGEVSVVACEKT
jgi:hypothetical protein